MSLKKKLAIIFSFIVSIVLLVNNTLFYFYTRDLLQKDQIKQMESLAKQISIAIDHTQFGAEYVEDLIGEKLRVAALAAQFALDPNIENVTNEELTALSKKLGVSYITLMVKEEGDIRGVKSSDPKERDLSTKEWGYWYDAFQQLFAEKQVTIPEGQKLENYWAGPMNVSASDPNHVDKWGYYFDGSTNYIISPYMRDNQIMDFKAQIGPDSIVKKTLLEKHSLLDITGFNPRTFGYPPVYTEQNGQKFIELSNQAIQFGEYRYQDEEDVTAVRSATETGQVVSLVSYSGEYKILKSFIPVPAEDPYVIRIVSDYKVIDEVLNEQLLNNILISFIVLVFVFFISYFLAAYVVRPIHRISQKVNEIADGNIGAQVLVKRKDELGMLSQGVNTMSTNLLKYTNELKDKNEEIKFHAYYDFLTGVPNLRLLNAMASEIIERGDDNFTLLYLDLDRFKYVNDMFGHSAGNFILKEVVERLRALLREDQTISRIGGDEFILLLPNTNRSEVKDLVITILTELEKPFIYEGNECFITTSIGISSYPLDSQDMETLLKYGDIAMYRAKEQGRNNYQFYSAEMSDSIERRAILEKGMRKALEIDEFT